MNQSLKALWTFALAAALVALPLKLSTNGAYIAAAVAKDGSNGNGGGNSQGGNNGNGNSQGASGNPPGGNGNSQGKGKSKGNGNKGTTSTSSTSSNPVTGDKVTVSPYAIELLHRNGMSERISGGRYQMRDAQRRIIVNRPATERDRRRLTTAIN